MRLIDAEALKPNIDKFIGYLDEDMIYRIKVVIDNAPTVEEQHPGKWVSVPFDSGMGIIDGYKCSVCDVSRVFSSKYCPNCGALMQGAEE